MKSYLENFIKHIYQLTMSDKTNLSDEDLDLLVSIFKEFKVKKGVTFIHEGSIFTHNYIVRKGLIRCYYTKDGLEITNLFAHENLGFTGLESFFLRTPSHMTVEALEDSILYGYSKDDFEELMEKNLNIAKFYRRLLEFLVIASERRVKSLQFKSANERFQDLLIKEPTLMQRVPAKYIASYLGITPETLSRIKGTI